MTTWGVIQALIDVGLGLGVFFIGMRILRQPKDDPRLSRGLQLLQAKISVLEDLSDRSETQVNQMVALLDQKAKELQAKIQLADKHVQLIQESMGKSLEVAQIFEDKIPHQEIIERQNTKKYLRAARLAHQGRSPEEIAKEIDLPMGEIEFISKVNKEQLMFSEDQLPEWAREQESANGSLSASLNSLTNSHASLHANSQMSAPNASTDMPAQVQLPDNYGVQKSIDETKRLSQLANQHELVENLQQVQQELESMLRHDSVMRDYSGAFNIQKPSTESLVKLGEEFRKARQEVESPQVPAGTFGAETSELSFFELTPPTPEQGPSMQQTMQEAAMKTAIAQPAQMLAHIQMPSNSYDDQSEQPLLDLSRDEIDQMQRSVPVPQMAQSQAPTAAPLIQQQAPPINPADVARAAALAQARAAAQELRRPQPKPSVQSQPAAGSMRPQTTRATEQAAEPPLVRRVQFPRIDGGKPR